MTKVAGNPGWSCRLSADMGFGISLQCRLKPGRIALAAIAMVFLAAQPAVAQAGNADRQHPRTGEETAADLELVLARHMAESQCEDPGSDFMRNFAPVIAQLSETAILYAIPCTAGAYNISYRLYRRETGEIGGVETLYFATWSGEYGWGGTDLLFNITVDGPQLSAFYKGRGLGDCGSHAQWIWRDHAYRLLRFAAEDTCAGVTAENWPVVYEYPSNGIDPAGR